MTRPSLVCVARLVWLHLRVIMYVHNTGEDIGEDKEDPETYDTERYIEVEGMEKGSRMVT